MDRKLPLLTHWVDPIPDRRETSTYWKHLLSSRRPPLRISLMGVALKCYKSFPWYWKNLSTVIVILKTSYKAPHSDCHQSFKYHIGKFPLPNDSSKFSRSHAAALWNTLRIWYLVLFLSLSQDTWTRSPCSFYYYGPGNGATKQHCLPRWLASNQSYDSCSKAPRYISPLWGERCKYVSIKVSLFLSSEESCLGPKVSFPAPISYLFSNNMASICLPPSMAWKKSVMKKKSTSLSPGLYFLFIRVFWERYYSSFYMIIFFLACLIYVIIWSKVISNRTL